MSDPITVAPAAAVVVTEAVSKAPAASTLAGEAMLWLGVAILLFLVYVFVKAQLDEHNKIDLTDLVIEPALGKITQGRFWGLVGGAAGTFVFIYLPVSGHFDATYASAYLLAAFGLKVAGDITGKPDAGPVAGVVEPLAPAIKPKDVGASVAIVRSTRKRKGKRGR